MTDTRKAMEQALEALEIVKLHFTQNRHAKEAIEGLHSALAQPDDKDLLTIAAMDAYQMGKRDALAQQGEPVGAVDRRVPGDVRWKEWCPNFPDGTPIYAGAAPAAQPDTRKVIEQLLYCVEAWERDCQREDYWRDRDDAITAGQQWLEENK